MLKRAVFVDRDGVLVKPILRNGFPYAPLRWEDFELLPGVAEAVGALKAAGFFVVVVTNQPEVRRGTLDPALLDAFHQLLRESVPVDAILDCRHDDRDHCDCRKPKPGMILDPARRYELDLRRSCLVGDTERDLAPPAPPASPACSSTPLTTRTSSPSIASLTSGPLSVLS